MQPLLNEAIYQKFMLRERVGEEKLPSCYRREKPQKHTFKT
jgi:hypothetical protein